MRFLAIAVITILTSACSGDPVRLGFNTNGVAHVDEGGRNLAYYDSEHSFFPIGLYHALSGTWQGQSFDLMQIRQAQFNTVHLWEGQDTVSAARAAAAAGLRSIIHFPSDDEIRELKDEPFVLGWYLDEEPSHLLDAADAIDALSTFDARREAIRKLDPQRPVFVIDGPHTPKVDAQWRTWAVTGDISAHFNYPVTVKKVRTETPPQRVAQTVAMARTLNNGKKPLWFVVQAFGGKERGWRMPTPAEYRSMVYSAIIQGATGIFVFAYDSFVLRDDGIIGVRADPKAAYFNDIDYNNDNKPFHVASEEELEAARLLWKTVIDVNNELKTLAPWVLSSTDAALPLVVDVKQGYGGDVVYIVKRRGERYIVIILNSGTSAVTLGLSNPDQPMRLKSLFNRDDFEFSDKDGWRVDLQPYGVAVLNVELSKGSDFD